MCKSVFLLSGSTHLLYHCAIESKCKNVYSKSGGAEIPWLPELSPNIQLNSIVYVRYFLQLFRLVLCQIYFVLDNQSKNDKVITAKSEWAALQNGETRWKQKKNCLICIQSDYNDEANTYTHIQNMESLERKREKTEKKLIVWHKKITYLRCFCILFFINIMLSRER